MIWYPKYETESCFLGSCFFKVCEKCPETGFPERGGTVWPHRPLIIIHREIQMMEYIIAENDGGLQKDDRFKEFLQI